MQKAVIFLVYKNVLGGLHGGGREILLVSGEEVQTECPVIPSVQRKMQWASFLSRF